MSVAASRQVDHAAKDRFRSHRIAAVAQVLAYIVLVGCGGDASTAHVSGTVTIDGEPLPTNAIATITFQTTKGGKGKPASAAIEESDYDSPSTPLGRVRVLITVQAPTGRTIDNGRGTPAQEYESIISYKYSSGIDLQIDGDRNDQDFDLSAR